MRVELLISLRGDKVESSVAVERGADSKAGCCKFSMFVKQNDTYLHRTIYYVTLLGPDLFPYTILD